MTGPAADRLRLTLWGVGMASRGAASAAVAAHAVAALAAPGGGPGTSLAGSALFLLSGVPAVLVSPVLGAWAAPRWRRFVGLGGALVAAGVLLAAALEPAVAWLSVAGILAIELGAYGCAALAEASRLRVTRRAHAPNAYDVLVLSGLGGGWLGLALHESWPSRSLPALLILPALGAALVLFGRRPPAAPIGPRGILAPFWRSYTAARLEPRGSAVIAQTTLWTMAAALAFIGPATRMPRDHATDGPTPGLPPTLIGLSVGAVLILANRNPYRRSGVMVYASLLGFLATLSFGADGSVQWLSGLIGLAAGLVAAPLIQTWQVTGAWQDDGPAWGWLALGGGLGLVGAGLTMLAAGEEPSRADVWYRGALAAATGLALVVSALRFFRPAIELLAEILLWPAYRLRFRGEGALALPVRGPCLVIGNHAAWLDPLFLAKAIPMPITAMMTSRFYDLPILSFLMRRVFGTIRVQEVLYRHEAPELDEAVQALDRGACIVLFPEGYLRRKDEVPLRRFARGVWKILSERPQTPVYACWIEGNWGSFFSWRDGPPMRRKRPDVWRRIDVGIHGPCVIDAELLRDHMKTRTYLMERVARARTEFGRPPVPLPTVADGEKE